jgi:hypothetical protein
MKISMPNKYITYILSGLFLLCSSLPATAEVSLLWKKTFDSRIVKTGHLNDLKSEK